MQNTAVLPWTLSSECAAMSLFSTYRARLRLGYHVPARNYWLYRPLLDGRRPFKTICVNSSKQVLWRKVRYSVMESGEPRAAASPQKSGRPSHQRIELFPFARSHRMTSSLELTLHVEMTPSPYRVRGDPSGRREKLPLQRCNPIPYPSQVLPPAFEMAHGPRLMSTRLDTR